jgi:hypothetical protein
MQWQLSFSYVSPPFRAPRSRKRQLSCVWSQSRPTTLLPAQELEKGKQIMKSLGIQAQTRVWQARFAGPEAGAVVVSIEYPSMAAFADGVAKSNASSEYQMWLKGLDKVRKIVSDSLYSEW